MSGQVAEQEPSIGLTEALGAEAGNPPIPRSSGEMLTALGRQWTVSALELRIKAQVEQWVRANALQACQEAEQENPEVGRNMFSAYVQDRGGKKYNWEGSGLEGAGSAIRSSLKDIAGWKYLFFLLLRRCHPSMTEDLANDIFLDQPASAGVAIKWSLGNEKAPAKNGKVGAKKQRTEKEEPETLDED